MNKLPKLFEEIIIHDDSFPSTDGDKVIVIEEYFKWLKKKMMLMKSADRFVQKQKGD